MIVVTESEQEKIPSSALRLLKPKADKFVPFFTGKKGSTYWYRGQRWFGPANKIGQPGDLDKLVLIQLPGPDDKPTGPFGVMPI